MEVVKALGYGLLNIITVGLLLVVLCVGLKIAIVHMMLNAGANIEATHKCGWTPLR